MRPCPGRNATAAATGEFLRHGDHRSPLALGWAVGQLGAIRLPAEPGAHAVIHSTSEMRVHAPFPCAKRPGAGRAGTPGCAPTVQGRGRVLRRTSTSAPRKRLRALAVGGALCAAAALGVAGPAGAAPNPGPTAFLAANAWSDCGDGLGGSERLTTVGTGPATGHALHEH